MNLLPDPLHPAIVHFPIVLILVGTATTVLSVFWRKGCTSQYSAVLLSAGAAAAWLALETGESDGGLLEESTSPAFAALLDQHQLWAERTSIAASTAAALAIGAALAFRWPKSKNVLASLAAVAGLTAGYFVFETGHRGGELVFRHGAGIRQPHLQTEATIEDTSSPLPRETSKSVRVGKEK